jgi:hypothetical protein
MLCVSVGVLRSGEAATRCRRPGAEAMALPFTCPLDYVLPPGRLDDDPARFGPALDAREWSFLEHPRAAWLRRVRPAPPPCLARAQRQTGRDTVC